MYTHEQRRQLLILARTAIEMFLTQHQFASLAYTEAALQEKRGAFVTLTHDGNLRGCIGFTEPDYPLHETIVRAAIAAAVHDPRFPPVHIGEMPMLEIEISVLSPLAPIAPEDVTVGYHGLVIEQGRARGLLLPQVPTEWGWDREEFLAHTCRKAGLPADAWRTGATLYAFTAEVFSEAEEQAEMEG